MTFCRRSGLARSSCDWVIVSGVTRCHTALKRATDITWSTPVRATTVSLAPTRPYTEHFRTSSTAIRSDSCISLPFRVLANLLKVCPCKGTAFQLICVRQADISFQRFNPLTPSFVIFDIRPERQSARMSKITNDGLTRPGTGCFIAVPMWHHWTSKGRLLKTFLFGCWDRGALWLTIKASPYKFSYLLTYLPLFQRSIGCGFILV